MSLRWNSDRTGAGAAGLALLLALVVPLLAGAAGDPHWVESASGKVELGRGEPPAWRAVAAGAALAPGDAVRTGVDGRAELRMGASSMRLYPNSLLVLPEDPNSPAVRLGRGSSLFDLPHGAGGRLDVLAPEVVVSVKGTRFSVDADAGVVAVYRGTVGVRSPAREILAEVLVREGFGAAPGAGESFELFVNSATDPWDGWAGGATLPMIPEGARTPPGAASVARNAASEASRSHSLREALRRRPELAARVAALAQERLRSGRGSGEVEKDRLEHDVLGEAAGDRKLGLAVEELFAEGLVGNNLNVSFVSGSGGPGSDRVVVDLPTGPLSLDEGLLEDVLEGTAALPANLDAVLASQGVNSLQFAQLLLALFPGH